MAAYMTRTTSLPVGISAAASSSAPRRGNKQRFNVEFTAYLLHYVAALEPTPMEVDLKDRVRLLLEGLIRAIEPRSRLLSFGSTANGFALRNSDMDLCCLIDAENRLPASDLVTLIGDMLERDTKFHVKPLPHARIPIIKLTLEPSPQVPNGLACDIGFENRLALENTRLLHTYASIDPDRVRTMVLFLKIWSKKRKINSPYQGTLSSYGYVLLVIYFLVHVKNPPVLPNLQQLPPLRPISQEDTHMGEHNTWFFDDIDLLRTRWRSSNTDSVAELLIDFFRYFARDFIYNTGVASIRAGLIKKTSKGWQNDLSTSRFNDTRERNRFCIEDPFELDYNVARCVTKDGLYTIRGEFMRASRVLIARPDLVETAVQQLLEERPDELISATPATASASPSTTHVTKLSSLPPQTPYTVGSTSRPIEQGLSPKPEFFQQSSSGTSARIIPIRPPPEHMAPKRSAWTSPPPPEAPPEDKNTFEQMFEGGLELATSSTEAREREGSFSSSASEVSVDDDGGSEAAESEDDVQSVRSFTEGSSSMPVSHRRPLAPVSNRMQQTFSAGEGHANVRLFPNGRGRLSSRIPEVTYTQVPRPRVDTIVPSTETIRRTQSHHGPTRSQQHRFSWAGVSLPLVTPLPPSPVSRSSSSRTSPIDANSIFYETSPVRYPPSPTFYPYVVRPGMPSFAFNTVYATPVPQTFRSEERPPPSPLRDATGSNLRPAGPDTPTPDASFSCHDHEPSHSHSNSTATVTASQFGGFTRSSRSPSRSRSPRPRSRTRSRSPGTNMHASVVIPSPLRAETTSTVRPEDMTSPISNSPPSSAGYISSAPVSPSPSPPSTSPPSPSLLKANFATKFEPVLEIDEISASSNVPSPRRSQDNSTPLANVKVNLSSPIS